MTRIGIEPRSPGPLANTLPTEPISRLTQTKTACNYGIKPERKLPINSIALENRKYIYWGNRRPLETE